MKIALSKSDDFACKDIIYERKIDSCRLTNTLLNSMFVNMFIKNIIDAADFKLECPYRAGHYTITNFTLHVPAKVPLPNDINVCLFETFYAQVAGKKKFEVIGGGTALISFNKK